MLAGKFFRMTQTNAWVLIYLLAALCRASSANPFGMFPSAGLMGGSIESAMLNFKTVCMEESGSDAGYQKVTNALHPTFQCVSKHLDLAQFFMDLSKNPETVEDRQAFTDKYCPALNESVPCLDDLLEAAAMCGKDKVSVLKPVYRKLVQNIIGMMCKNNGQVLYEFRSPEYLSCIGKTNLQQCDTADFIWGGPISQIGEIGCSEFRRSKRCIHEQVSTCSTKAYEDVFDAMNEPYVEAANCKDIF